MKATVKEYNLKAADRDQLRSMKYYAEQNEDWSTYFACERDMKRLDEEFFDLLPTVSISYYIGYRSYYSEVVKIGKSYFMHYSRMTKSRGYRGIEEIAEITDKMKEDMISDSYYY